ncbi:hypothetical protein A3C21_03835 [Candidatus Kaiserbacteria bacterium RIFCSPHIGHO2_02_FULL_59_21]|uniref:Metallo-beta-lactamase domain-containing protein n=1 Tax=Candidatus Kaiserbacteria bacterium RIFCSPHIGHO2_02_FULL_59_21 TaxID=1798500 RepID=A0A1F6E1P5_9BACT|nr:MAG: hypothetical protein A2766_02325 [Candidatus Kaiserbacteria bacterium RIFCSPHIGHO2_01_FULL_58_22]OGG67581.1 MAG: hypothetical protein A3C21_03835 [Candidatus Kaiserbacteria bacterium RIFCSPHIGHO2_02_FULL_59_21]OGG80651.1 MAG: hypothetical protein A2952_02490 [Candidatus Kaiserbacteria bacterium RIFCSPLOWO2_01_FULL_59_34]OGG85434.1 MAG: hypothetical protein A3I47_03670 [Candidatus Kaiserbacteria bacterium RIFCSPLOWO2_02_FULL_59_19]
MRRSALVSGIVVLILFALAIGIWYAVISEDRGGKLTVSFLNVGQGDAIFIDAPSGRQALIDGGRGRVVLRELARASPWWDRSIDVVVATHPDLDHIGGLPDVLARYRVGLVMRSSVLDEGSADSAAFDAAADAEAKQGAALLVAKRGQIIDLGGGASMEVLYPDRDVSGVETNAGSIVARLVYGETAFMLTGDAPQAIEEYLALLDGKELHSNVLKAGHHGSKTSSSELFIGFVSPEYAVFSRGCDNSYGHPHAEVVALFKRFEIPALDTCKDGAITFVSDGTTVRRR